MNVPSTAHLIPVRLILCAFVVSGIQDIVANPGDAREIDAGGDVPGLDVDAAVVCVGYSRKPWR